MTFDFSKWMRKYGDVAPDESIEYKDSSGAWNEETDYSLSSISSQFQQRGYIFRDELRKIGKWKAGGRIDHHLKKNSTSSVERQTKLAFQAPSDEAAVEAFSLFLLVLGPDSGRAFRAFETEGLRGCI